MFVWPVEFQRMGNPHTRKFGRVPLNVYPTFPFSLYFLENALYRQGVCHIFKIQRKSLFFNGLRGFLKKHLQNIFFGLFYYVVSSS